jgi:WD40 repeat protein
MEGNGSMLSKFTLSGLCWWYPAFLLSTGQTLQGVPKKQEPNLRMAQTQEEWHCVVFSPDGKTLATGGHKVILWDLATGRPRLILKNFRKGPVWSLAFSPNGKKIATGAQAGEVKLWDTLNGKEIAVFRGHYFGIASMAFSPDGRTLITTGGENAIQIWDLVRRRAQALFRFPFKTHDKENIFARVPRRPTPPLVFNLKERAVEITCVAFLPGGNTFVAATGAQRVRFRTVATGKVRGNICTGHPQGVFCVRPSPDGKLLATGGGYGDGTVQLWELPSGRKRATLKAHHYLVKSLSFSPDGKTLLTVGEDCAKLWDLTTGRVRAVLLGDSFWGIRSAAIAPNGKIIATVVRPGSVRFWDFFSGCLVAHVPGPSMESWFQNRKLSPNQARQLWKSLAGPDAAKADNAIWDLAAAPRHSVNFLKKYLGPAIPVQTGRLVRWVAELDSDKYAVRKRATTCLEAVADQARPALIRALGRAKSLEVRDRLRSILWRNQQSWTNPADGSVFCAG